MALHLSKIALQVKTALVKLLLFCQKKNYLFSLLKLANLHRISSKKFMSHSLEGMGAQVTVRGVVMFGDSFYSIVNSLRLQCFLKKQTCS